MAGPRGKKIPALIRSFIVLKRGREDYGGKGRVSDSE